MTTQENLTQYQEFASKLPAVFAASAFSYTLSNIRLTHGLSTSVKDKAYTFSEVQDDEISDWLDTLGMTSIVVNAVMTSSRIGYLKWKDGIPVLGINLMAGRNSARIEACGDSKEVKEFHDLFKNTFRNNTFEVTQVDSIANGNVNARTQKIELDSIRSVTQDFYPWFEENIEEYFKDYFKSDKTVLLMIGSPGLGKTSLCRNLIKSYGDDVMIANNATLFEDSSLFEHFAASDTKLLLVEDADNAVISREQGNMGMSYLLNLTDGIIPIRKKIVIVTNLSSINKVDPALIRPGRCHDILEFRPLTAKEAQAARASIGLPHFDLSEKSDKWSLAEALNYDVDLKLEARKKTSTGFLNS